MRYVAIAVLDLGYTFAVATANGSDDDDNDNGSLLMAFAHARYESEEAPLLEGSALDPRNHEGLAGARLAVAMGESRTVARSAFKQVPGQPNKMLFIALGANRVPRLVVVDVLSATPVWFPRLHGDRGEYGHGDSLERASMHVKRTVMQMAAREMSVACLGQRLELPQWPVRLDPNTRG
ncbi:hypothetical protein BCR44DRAFT_49422 [Catenaria anguillulae PL171]|uniref:Uncharacterized protein n=1 Tax=Catenaria anguillulae PL171 TaxID=765915 RepID=A0A1Y2HLB1_9FUNG|nr:hypothetical protein BCR44DRAFT_49422 [Catenaria anguillulae PL171]